MPTSKLKYIFDTSVAIHIIENFKLCTQLKKFSEEHTLLAPIRVLEEFSVGKKDNPKPDITVFKQIFKLVDVEIDQELETAYFYNSDDGEAYVISYALKHKAEVICAIDEAHGRNLCRVSELSVIGTIGILREMKNKGLLTAEDLSAIKATDKSKLRLSHDLLRELDELCS